MNRNSLGGAAGIVSRMRYELQDNGPEFIRCAIKSVELMNILHLALPDNMLGFAESEMLAKMIERNPKLMTLILSNNRLDHRCSSLIGQALTKNDHLIKLDMSKNCIGDLGVLKLLKPLIQQRIEIN